MNQGLAVQVEDGVTLRVRHRPGPLAPAFLLVHGLESNARLWDQVAGYLSEAGHASYAVDLRGHGESDAPEHGYDNATAIADLAAVGTALGLSGVVVAGHSWGGHLAVRLTAEHPGLVSALAMLEGGWAGPAAIYRSWEVFEAVIRSMVSLTDGEGATVTRMRDYLRIVHPDWSAEAIEASLRSMRVRPDGTLAPALSEPQRAAIMRSLWDEPPDPWFPAITVPVLMMPAFPKDNPQWPPSIRALVDRIRDCVYLAAAELPQATIREYADSDHDLHAQHPRRVAEDLLALARGSTKPPASGRMPGRGAETPGQ
jgi:pimeloyl-ACP methyl ester carboxylesterase